ncbi:MAG: DM13 domain-containing protein [bacterium]|nr:DM13 domain-containing protein [bacterium]
MRNVWLIWPALLLAGCVGTDYIADAPAQGVSRIDVQPTSVAVAVGQIVGLQAVFIDEAGQVVADIDFTWTSSNPAVAGISEAGVLSGLGEGQAYVFASTADVVSDSILVGVVADAENQVAATRAGAFVGRDDNHENRGTALLQPGMDGALVLSFSDDFYVTAGPGLEIFLATQDAVGPGSLGIGPLQSDRGAQAYPLSGSVRLTDYNWVLIHCVPFNITFGKARLQ